MGECKVLYAPNEDITINKWKVKDGARINCGSLVLMYFDGSSKELKRLKSTTFGIVKKRLFKEGDMVSKGRNSNGRTVLPNKKSGC